MGKRVRALILTVLFAGPFAVYIGFGFLWMLERGWIWPTIAALVWIAAGVVFALLAARWTREPGKFLPYFDADTPATFSPRDKEAWEAVLQAGEHAAEVTTEQLTSIDLYIDTAKHLVVTISKLYHPGVADPMENVPVLEALTALELAAEDLHNLSRQIPGSDLVTPGHVKSAVRAAEYYQKASEWYGYLLPLVNPASGLPRLVSQRFMVNPAWRDMKQNLARWFYQAFVTRLGVHLIELYSGRLAVGAARYRQLTRRLGHGVTGGTESSLPIRVAVAGARSETTARIVAAIGKAEIPSATLNVAPAYGFWTEKESREDRSTRRKSVAAAADADAVILAVDDRSDSRAADLAFLSEWTAWFTDHPQYQRPPLILVVAGADRTRLEALEAGLPEAVSVVMPIDADQPDTEKVVDAIVARRSEIERAAVIRSLGHESSRSKAGRLFEQLGKQGRAAWSRMRSS